MSEIVVHVKCFPRGTVFCVVNWVCREGDPRKLSFEGSGKYKVTKRRNTIAQVLFQRSVSELKEMPVISSGSDIWQAWL